MVTILTQTDTTVGFVSQDASKLYEIKSRSVNKPFLKVYDSFGTFVEKNRVPSSYKKLVRRSKKTTFIVKNRAFRVAKFSLNSQLLRDLKWHYSTSANKTDEDFSREFCENVVDVVIENSEGLMQKKSSKLLKLGKNTLKRLR